MKSLSTEYFSYVKQMLGGFRAGHERKLASLRSRDISPYLDAHQSLRILDVANGRLRPQYTILRSQGHQVVGVDFVNQAQISRVDFAYALIRRLYSFQLKVPSTATNDRALICGNVNTLPILDGYFDLITSIAAFEHFLDVPAVVAELHRVLGSGGVAWICLHAFTSPSGGHNVSLTQIPLRHLPRGVEAWDHLRQRHLPFHVPLNEWRIQQYVDEFAKHFEILKHYCAMREGEEFLTPQIEAELSAYTRDELTCGAYVIVARKI